MQDAVERIKGLLIKKNMTQKQLASESGLTKETINRILNGKQELRPNTLEKIAQALNVSTFDLHETLDDRGDQYKIAGYIEFGNGIIRKISSLKSLRDIVEEIERREEIYNFKEAILPPQKNYTIDDIDYLRYERIDATEVLVRGFKSQEDIVEGKKFNVGNMAKGFGFDLEGVRFNNSEAAYISGLFSNNTPEHRRIQEELVANDDGWKAKKEIRNKYRNVGRRDWTEPDPHTGIPFNVEWMKWVVWQKCKTNPEFAELLRQVPLNAMIVEDSTGNHDSTARVWGCHNEELRKRRDMLRDKYRDQHPKAKKKEIDEAALKMNNAGVWEGRNVMGKILKACSICLHTGQELEINEDQLFKKEIYLLGRRLKFGKIASSSIISRYIQAHGVNLVDE